MVKYIEVFQEENCWAPWRCCCQKITSDWRNATTQDLCTKTHSQEAEIGFQLPLLHHVSFTAVSAASLLEGIQCRLKGLKYFAWDITVSVFLIKSAPSIGWDLQDGFSAEEDSTYSIDSSFSVYITYGSDCVNWRCCFIHSDLSLSRGLTLALVHSPPGSFSDISSGPYGDIFWASLPRS